MLVSVVIVNYNTFALTCACIDSIIRYTKGVAYEIIVVDNASTKDDASMFLQKFPDVKLVRNPENSGFAKGNNLGISRATGDMILLLNSDAYLKEDSISITANYIKNNPKAGFVSARLVYEDGKYQSNARKFRSIRNELLDLARPVLMLMSYRKRARLMLNQYFKGDFNTTCDWLSGAFLMFPRDILDKLPGQKLDERFFMYGEDHLWGYQVQAAGYGNYFLADTTAVHIANASTDPGKRQKLLQTMLKHELTIMAERKGTGLYYQFFKVIFTAKEMARYYIKVLALRLLGKQIR
ncbi:MAG: glycosyltransferase family 2 protein [Sphingobacteriales bacterium]|nr:MAG: glycosyltransferase family 2 protein [Sphingobacteriales bacterium]